MPTRKPCSQRFPTPVLFGSALLSGLLATTAHAQMRLEEVIVTAQKREQSLQDVPVAVTALTRDAIEVNNVVDVNDLSGLAPNMTVRPSAGGVNIPAFSMRGITSYGVVAGSDKQISIYLDGVYIGSPRGSIFQLPDIERLEVLRGPQGTLFGRNATGGAISIATRDPLGEFAFRQKLGIGNRDYLRSDTTIDLPSFGNLSAYFTYSKEEQDGDIDNLGAGVTWDRTGFNYGKQTSPDTLGDVDSESFFFSALWEPTDALSVSYKFDYATDEGTPTGNALVSDLYTGTLPPDGAAFLNLLAEANPDLLWNGKTTRPNAVNNAWSVNRDQEVQGHNLTVTWEISDNLLLKNTLAYREADVFQPADISGTSGWVIGDFVAMFVGLPGDTPFCYACSQSNGESEQFSNELQLTWDGDWGTVTGGVLYYDSDDESGSPRDSVNTFIFGFFPEYVVPNGNQGYSLNQAESYAAYAQAEIAITDDLDLLAGLRYTKDDKSGNFVQGTPEAPVFNKFEYDDDHVDYLIGVNYAISDAIMAYAKFSTAYVSGGSVAGFGFEPEEAESWEIGSKADFLDGRLRANLALFDVSYDNLQTAQSGANVEGAENISVLIVEGGKLEAQGAELELTALPFEGLTLSAGIGYQDVEFAEVTDEVAATVFAVGPNAFPNSSFEPTLVPEWNTTLSANYESEPLFANAYLSLGITGIWHDDIRLESNPGRAAATPFGSAEFSPATWNVNARAALKSIEFGDHWVGEIALWGRNLTDSDELNFVTNFGGFVSGTFEAERSYGIDLVLSYE
ncbi:TonB-dependent receptor [Mangrovimicrobium sediminis]|uniref:TonB-dependent receptor n=1 Tax=Mangrovimicrobium sediminis TaxID=2562682 RepID=A0A4Z0LW32_9GAMM|nr:TonB-dependent receptor [Haliea sp. SAOS-164]TGD71285.1 TonB-dependent receptor [Haliea sp. SAOS-164]